MATYSQQQTDVNDSAHDNLTQTDFIKGGILKGDSNTASASAYAFGSFFDTVTPAQGATISSATFTFQARSATQDDANGTFYGNDVDNANDFTAEADVVDRARTTASTALVQDGLGQGDTVVDVTAIVQEIVNRPGWSANNNMVILWVPNTDANKTLRPETVATTAAEAPQLDITYTDPVGGGGTAPSGVVGLTIRQRLNAGF